MHVRSRTSKKDLEIFEKFKNKNFFDLNEVSHLSKLLPEKKINILEIGFGDGNNLIEKAMANSNMNFYGIEVFKSGIASVLKQVQIHDLKNICLFYGDAKDFLEKIEKPFFDFIFILFPDLKEKGRLIVKTDWQDYADDIKKDFAEFKVLHDSNVLQSLKPIQTKYEGKAIEEGREVFTYITDLNA